MLKHSLACLSSLVFTQATFSFQQQEAENVLTTHDQTYWNNHRAELEEYLKNNQDLTFKDLLIQNKDLSSLELHHLVFKKCRFEDIIFHKTSLTGTILFNNQFYKCCFIDTDLTETTFQASEFYDSCFSQSSLADKKEPSSPSPSTADFYRVKFYDSKFYQMDFSGTPFEGTSFIRCGFVEVDFRNADLRNSLFIMPIAKENVRLHGAQLANGLRFDANLHHPQLIENYDGFVKSGNHFKARGLNNAFALINLDLKKGFFVYLDLRGIQLIKAHLENSSFFRSNFNGAVFQNVKGTKANLYGSNFQKTILDKVNLDEANLTQTDLEGVKIRGEVSLCGTEVAKDLHLPISQADYERARQGDFSFYSQLIKDYSMYRKEGDVEKAEGINKALTLLSFLNPQIKDVKLSRLNLSGIKIQNAQFTNVVMQGTILTNAQLVHCTFNNTDLRGSNLTGTEFTSSKFKEGVKLENALLERDLTFKANMYHFDLVEKYSEFIKKTKNSNLSDEIRTQEKAKAEALNRIFPPLGLQLQGEKFIDPDLSGIRLENADLSGVTLNKANLTNAVLVNVNLKGAKLKGADLSGACLERVDFTGSDLEDAKLDKTVLSDCDLTEVNLKGVNLESTSMSLEDLAKLDGLTGHLAEITLCKPSLEFEEEIISEGRRNRKTLEEEINEFVVLNQE